MSNYFHTIQEKNLKKILDKKAPLFINDLSLQTLHRMPSEQWGYRPVFPTVIFLSTDKELSC